MFSTCVTSRNLHRTVTNITYSTYRQHKSDSVHLLCVERFGKMVVIESLIISNSGRKVFPTPSCFVLSFSLSLSNVFFFGPCFNPWPMLINEGKPCARCDKD